MSLNAETASIYRALGLPENKPLPEGPIEPRMAEIISYGGRTKGYWMVRLATREQANVQRVQAKCPGCSRWFAAGNLNQHLHSYRTRKGSTKGCPRR